MLDLQALQWAEVEGGPKSPLLCDLWYFVNRFTFIKVFASQKVKYIHMCKFIHVLQGKELTKWFKLRESGSSVRCVALCCKSTLLVQHPAYRWTTTLWVGDRRWGWCSSGPHFVLCSSKWSWQTWAPCNNCPSDHHFFPCSSKVFRQTRGADYLRFWPGRRLWWWWQTAANWPFLIWAFSR